MIVQTMDLPASSSDSERQQAGDEVRASLTEQAEGAGRPELVETITITVGPLEEDPENWVRVTGTIGDEDLTSLRPVW